MRYAIVTFDESNAVNGVILDGDGTAFDDHDRAVSFAPDRQTWVIVEVEPS